MQLKKKTRQIRGLLGALQDPWPAVLDSLRLQRRPYTAQLRNGVRFRLEAGQGDWFTLYEVAIRRDYLPADTARLAGCDVIDVGANFGAFAVLASGLIGPGGTVHAFEPDPQTFARLVENVTANGCQNVVCHNQALSDRDGESSFFRYGKSAMGSLYRRVANRDGSDAQEIRVQTRDIRAILADWPRRIGLLKIDCEGAEYTLFDRLGDLSLDNVDHICIETHEVPGRSSAEIVSCLQERGFNVPAGRTFVASRFAEA